MNMLILFGNSQSFQVYTWQVGSQRQQTDTVPWIQPPNKWAHARDWITCQIPKKTFPHKDCTQNKSYVPRNFCPKPSAKTRKKNISAKPSYYQIRKWIFSIFSEICLKSIPRFYLLQNDYAFSTKRTHWSLDLDESHTLILDEQTKHGLPRRPQLCLLVQEPIHRHWSLNIYMRLTCNTNLAQLRAQCQHKTHDFGGGFTKKYWDKTGDLWGMFFFDIYIYIYIPSGKLT